MKYESELLAEIIANRGHEKSSIHYESECKEAFIEEYKGSYPKLCDYESEWLNYIVENPIGEFPYEMIKDVTEATINNVVPFAFKSAILKGCTLVNVFQNMDYVWNNIANKGLFTYDNGELTILNNGQHDGRYWNTIPKLQNLKPNTTYTMVFTKGSSPMVECGTIDDSGTPVRLGWFTNAQKIKITTPSNGDLRVKLSVSNPASTESTINLGKVMFIEGDYTDINIPYFEGMQSVQMPVLTTSNEDGTKTNILSCLEPVELGSVGEVKDELNLLTQQLTQRTETRPYQEGDELNSEFVTDMTNTRYKLAQEVVKTVDLNIVNQDGQTLSKLKPIEGTMHMETNGEPLKPLLSAEVPVEAITQNLNSFIEGD